jgi:hypothetical protein
MSIALSDLADEIADIALLDFVDALCSPIRNNVPAEQARYSLAGSGLGNMISNEGLDQILELIDDKPAARLLLLFSGVSAIEPRGKDLLRLSPRHRQGDATVRADCVFAQPRSCACDPIHNQKDLPSLRGHLETKPGRPASQ